MNCINCNQEVTDNFCSHCGQRTNVKRINLKEGWFDFWSRVYGFDGMFPRTLRDLTIRPGVVAQKFMDGNRASYYGPVGYFFLMISLFLLILSFMDMSFMEFMKGVQSYVPVENKGSEFQNEMQTSIADNLKIFAFLQIPFQALIAKKVFFRKSERNFMEHNIIPLYSMGHLYWLLILYAIIYKTTGSFFHLLFHPLISFVYYGFAYSTHMVYQSKVKAFFKGTFVYLVGLLTFMLALSIVLIGYVTYLGVTNPDSLKMFK